MVRGSRPCAPAAVVPALEVGGGSRLLRDYGGAGGDDDVELAEPPCIKNVGYELMRSRNGEE